MINITLLNFDDGTPRGFIIKGHSGSAERGRDIVCAAVSSAAYLTANTLLETVGVKADAEVDDGYMKFVVDETCKSRASDFLNGFALHLNQLREQYPAYVSIITEV